ncbi:TIGR01459 family HAD-type hydrolase [Hyphomicrobium methylovorum]|uniref:TIGR01459 family HAD-type hydrolase n=1 Tax=Hyphomicrobium methylovorum TaxID=84 RepID=UPI0015E77FFA|nr:TIGR01459 family HAD-type hydrolase [Hyphomicrobium methylovorum]MBA2127038.1 TIGR01459 family HAD-type hydrolase [Hyphomicrobium methylovorum]
MTSIPVLSSIEPLAAETDLWFVDIWGVMHNGVRPYTAAVAACEAFRAKGGTVLLVSNAPRPHDSVIRQLDSIGVSGDAYDAVLSSGDVSRSLIEGWAGRPMLHIGPERDLPIFVGLGSQPGADVEEAEVVVCTGLFDDETETPADYGDRLGRLHARGVPMICANPDQRVERGGRLIYCAGAIASAYEALGGRVQYAGKPYRPIYDLALAAGAKMRGGDVPKERVFAIGDGVATDILGASQFGIRSVFVASGVHVRIGESLSEASSRLFASTGVSQPVGVMGELAW